MILFSLMAVAGVGICITLVFAARYYGIAQQARNKAAFLSRIGSSDAASESLLSGATPARIAKNPTLQRVLHDVPFVLPLADLLEQTGKKTTVVELFLYQMGCAVTVVVAGSFLNTQFSARLLIAMLSLSLPVFWAMNARAKRAVAFEMQLPQVMEMIALFLRSGRSLPQAFVGATEEITPPASEEFMVCAEEYRLGRPLDVALKRLALKYPNSVGFRLFSIAVSVLGQTGGNLVEVLERIKKTLDAGVTYGLRLKSLTGESRTSAWILGVLPGAFMAIAATLNPEYFSGFFETKLGRTLFGVFLGLWFAGIIWIRRLMQSKVV